MLKIWISKYLILTFIRQSVLKDCVKDLQNFSEVSSDCITAASSYL